MMPTLDDSHRGRKWTDGETVILHAFMAHHATAARIPWGEIAVLLRRTPQGVADKWAHIIGRKRKELMPRIGGKRAYSRSALPGAHGYATPSEQLIADRERRRELIPRDLTAALMGDPLPGLSALDQRR
jgi:hypothetical protein